MCAGDARTWGTRVLLVQLHQDVALVRNGEMLHIWTLAELAASVPTAGSPALPRVFRVDPVCLSSMAGTQARPLAAAAPLCDPPCAGRRQTKAAPV